METILSNPWIVTVIGGAFAALIPVLITYLVKRQRTPHPLTLCKKGLQELSSRELFSFEDLNILHKALSDHTFQEVFEKDALGPDEEIRSLSKAILHAAPTSSQLADITRTEAVAEQILYAEFVLESRYPAYHESKRYERRRDFFERKKQSASSSKSVNTKELELRVQPSLVVQTQPATQPLSRPFFSLLEHIHGIANNCVGREQSLHRLYSDFEDSNHRLIVIEGFGGIGKTTLAARLAVNASHHYNILWVSCQGIEVTTERVLREIGRFASEQDTYPWLIDIAENTLLSLEEKLNGLLEFLAFVSKTNSASSENNLLRPIALFFDDYHLVKDRTLDRLIEKIAEFYVDVKVVLIIRHSQPFSNRLQIKVNSSDPLLLNGLSFADCRSFIAKYSASYPLLGNLSDKTLSLIWKRTGEGVPNALEIFISMTRTRSVNDILEQLPDYDPLAAATRKQWFDGLFNELSTEEQQVAAEISIFPRPTSRRAIIYVSRCNKVDEVIDALVRRFILLFDGELYAMHALWSDYIKQQISANEMRQLHRKAAMFYRNLVSSNRYTIVMNNLESCYHFLKAEDIEDTMAILLPMASTLRSWGIYEEILNIIAEIEEIAQRRNEALMPELLVERSAILHEQGEVEQAIETLKELVEAHSGEIQINALNRLAWMYIEAGNRRDAEQCFFRSRELARSQKLPMFEGDAMKGLHHLAYIESNYAEALEYNQQRLKIFLQLPAEPDVQEAIALTYRDIGNIYREQGFYTRAMELYQQTLDIFNALGDPPSHTGWLTYDIGLIQLEWGNLKEAQTSFEKAMLPFKIMQYTHGIAHVMIELGRVGIRLDRSYKGIEQVEEAIILLRHIKLISGEAYGLRVLGEIYLYLGDPDHALLSLQQSLAIDENILHGTKGMALSLYDIALAYEEQGKRLLVKGERLEAATKFHEAQKTIIKAQALLTQLGAISNFGTVIDDAARIEREYAESKEAESS